jgi:hypothetical protein
VPVDLSRHDEPRCTCVLTNPKHPDNAKCQIHGDESRCSCGLLNPGPEHQAHYPMLCSDKDAEIAKARARRQLDAASAMGDAKLKQIREEVGWDMEEPTSDEVLNAYIERLEREVSSATMASYLSHHA